MLRASTLATLTATFLSFGAAHGAFADGRGDWDGYAWQKIDIADCTPSGALLECPLYHQKWDWKRDQWVDMRGTVVPLKTRNKCGSSAPAPFFATSEGFGAYLEGHAS